jgi:hypothetical protein
MKKIQTTGWENTSTSHTLDKAHDPRRHEELLKLSNKKIQYFANGQRCEQMLQKDIRMAST